MREHMGLYRGKRIDNGEWVEGYYAATLRYNNLHWIWNGKNHISVDPDTVGECTGLWDENGKLIFEGDIVNSYNMFGELEACGVVHWSDIFTGWHIADCKSMYGGSIGNYEIIGNIHDNPELLKGGERE